MAQRAMIEPRYIVMAVMEWSADMIPLAAMEMQGIADDFAIHWTKEHHEIFHKTCSAGVYDGITGKLLTGYRNGELIINNQRKAAPVQ